MRRYVDARPRRRSSQPFAIPRVTFHVGFAISQVDEAAALATLQTFEELGMLDEELAELKATEGDGIPIPR